MSNVYVVQSLLQNALVEMRMKEMETQATEVYGVHDRAYGL